MTRPRALSAHPVLSLLNQADRYRADTRRQGLQMRSRSRNVDSIPAG
ncbi:MAG: hypothetical protein AAGG53_10420 [Cyanobacteria bacterium P01_H01_bin.152]